MISDNVITNNVGASLSLMCSHHNIVINNTVYEEVSGIFLASSTCNFIVANRVYSNHESCGIGLAYSSNNTVEDNWLTGNYQGISLGYSPLNILKDNIILNSSYAGIGVSDFSPNNLVVGNTVSNNQVGIKIIGSNYSLFYHNSFINNVNNHYAAMEYYPINFWNNSFGEGNYWSNYTGIDSDGDGVGDTPHPLYIYNQDYHPLMSPYIPGDCNHDGIVNIADAAKIGIAWNTTKGMPAYNPHADLNMDNAINMADAEIIRKNWQKHV